jgi:hypothetical protein
MWLSRELPLFRRELRDRRGELKHAEKNAEIRHGHDRGEAGVKFRSSFVPHSSE